MLIKYHWRSTYFSFDTVRDFFNGDTLMKTIVKIKCKNRRRGSMGVRGDVTKILLSKPTPLEKTLDPHLHRVYQFAGQNPLFIEPDVSVK